VALDVRGQVRDLELPQLSPYSSKYAGYGIERGKLSAEVNYRIGADGQLQASHQIVLNQLRFGDRSDSEDAPNLPVKLAVALLADRNGVIDLQLPVSGSINDPDFRVGAIVWKMVLNLIGKAILSPFSLLTGALSGEEQLEQMAFAAGQADVDAATRQKLQTVAQLLIDKPALRLTLVGQADLAAEREAWRSAQLRDMVLAEKRRRLSRDGQSASAVTEVGREEYPALLQAVYRRSPVPKPRNVLGLVKDLPPADMEALLLAAITVDESDMRALAQARAQQVREVLLALNVPAEQLFLGAEVVTGGPRVPYASSTSPTSAFVPQVALTISTD
jgi:outer membrane protein OmpA-like peptidoglycan-associated protein